MFKKICITDSICYHRLSRYFYFSYISTHSKIYKVMSKRQNLTIQIKLHFLFTGDPHINGNTWKCSLKSPFLNYSCALDSRFTSAPFVPEFSPFLLHFFPSNITPLSLYFFFLLLQSHKFMAYCPKWFPHLSPVLLALWLLRSLDSKSRTLPIMSLLYVLNLSADP